MLEGIAELQIDPQIDVIDIPDFYGAVTKDELIERQLQHAIGTTFLRANSLNIAVDGISIIVDLDETLRTHEGEILTPGRIPNESLRALASAERMGARFSHVVTNNVVKGVVSIVAGKLLGYDYPEKAIRNNLPGTAISAARFVGERPKKKEATIEQVAQHMLQELELMRGEEKLINLITMYGNAPQDLEFFNEMVSCMRKSNPERVAKVHLLFINFPQRIPGFICRPLRPLYRKAKAILG